MTPFLQRSPLDMLPTLTPRHEPSLSGWSDDDAPSDDAPAPSSAGDPSAAAAPSPLPFALGAAAAAATVLDFWSGGGKACIT